MDTKTKYIVNELINHVCNLRKDFMELNFQYNRLQERVLKIENPSLAKEQEAHINMVNRENAKIADKYMAELRHIAQQMNDDR